MNSAANGERLANMIIPDVEPKDQVMTENNICSTAEIPGELVAVTAADQAHGHRRAICAAAEVTGTEARRNIRLNMGSSPHITYVVKGSQIEAFE